MVYQAGFDNKREFGIELEGYGFSPQEVIEVLARQEIPAYIGDGYSPNLEKWAIGRDGTVRHSFPLEVVSPVLSGEKGLLEIRKVCDALNSLGIKTDISCGFHVHWNVKDYTGSDMINLLRLYGRYEKVLDFIFHPSRRSDSNPFIHSLLRQDSMAWLYRLQGAFYRHAYQIAQEFEATQATSNTTSYPTARHHKVNICAYNKYRTVEFRQHEGTFDYEEIKNWIIFSQQLVDRAKHGIAGEGMATWDNLLKVLGLTSRQLRDAPQTPERDCLEKVKNFYDELYWRNKDAADLGS